MTTGFKDLPLSSGGGGGGSSSYLDAVLNAASLPASGNNLYDVRYVVDANTFYVWNGSSWAATASSGGGSSNNYFPSGWA